MQAVLLAAGASSRFFPFNLTHKSSMSLLGKPIIQHTVESLRSAGIKRFIIIVSDDGVIMRYLGDGASLGVEISYVVQPSAQGAGEGLLRAKSMISEWFFLVNPSHVDAGELTQLLMDRKTRGDVKAVMLCKEEEDVQEYGVLNTEGEYVRGIVEKPLRGEEPTHLRTVGMYLFSPDFLTTLAEVPQEHYMLETAINRFAQSHQVGYMQMTGQVLTLKYPWHLFGIRDYLMSQITTSIIHPEAHIHPTSHIEGSVIIEKGATVDAYAVIKGPVYVGEGAYIGTHTLLRDGTNIEKNSVIGAYMEAKNIIVQSDSKTHSGVCEDTVIGRNVRIGAAITTGNVRFDRDNIQVLIGEKKIDTKRRALGCLIGDEVNTGIGVMTMPGIIIGTGAIIGPGTVVHAHIPVHTRYYRVLTETVSKSLI
jgi:bifunctional UDP-N-acetylglucosamine pyrophosphorylase/glucosamine-1-phosphate N-acetyltransferase